MAIPARHTPAYRIAALAHELWRTMLAAQGWKRAKAFDQSLKRHDALVPFNRLPPQDRARLISRVESANLSSLLLDQIDYPRGEERELTIADMRVGRRVGLRHGSGEIGRVESWQTEPNTSGGRQKRILSSVRVRWDDGEVTEHAVIERELHLPS